MLDLIIKKRDGGALDDAELQYFVRGAASGEIPDYQIAALLMAIYFRGMSAAETATLTRAIADSGERLDLSAVRGVAVDKHSTGGVGDKTTLIVLPIVASLGVRAPKLSGRGLGHTGGTIDKLESIPGFRTDISIERLIETVNRVGVCVGGQSRELAPADKTLYALRDVTATVESLPLIASSVMSKKLASGAKRLLLDVKAGSGAFMKSPADAVRLAEAMVGIGKSAGCDTVALITDMSVPLGLAIGNALEVREAAQTLLGRGPRDLTELSIALAAQMLSLAGIGAPDACAAMARRAIEDGSAHDKFAQWIAAQGGDLIAFDAAADRRAPVMDALAAPKAGFICAMDAHMCGRAAMLLGAGRQTKDELIDPHAGITLLHKPGARVTAGEAIALLHTSRKEARGAARELLLQAIQIGDQPPAARPLVIARVDEAGTEYFGNAPDAPL